MGTGFSVTWKDIKTQGPTILRGILTETAMEGLQDLNGGERVVKTKSPIGEVVSRESREEQNDP